MSLARARELILASYHDLPNVLFMGSLLIGVLTGYLPLIWMALGLIMNAAIIEGLQRLLGLVFPDWEQLKQPRSPACLVGFERMMDYRRGAVTGSTQSVAPSHWLGASIFFAIFSIYNSIRVAIRPSATGVDQEKVDSRRAFTLSTLIIGVVFLCLVLLRGYTGCETLTGGILTILISGGLGVGFWHMLDACGTGRIPDILQVVGSMAPEGKNIETPVVCSAVLDE
jgi:hypothetical protein